MSNTPGPETNPPAEPWANRADAADPAAGPQDAHTEPAVVTQDDPESGLDSQGRESFQVVLRDIASSQGTVIAAAIVLSLLTGALLVAAFNPDVARAAGYLFARPADFFREVGDAISGYFTSLFRGAIFDYQAPSFTRAIRPLTETLTNSVPLIFAGLAVGIGFRGGLFNIGAQGQLIIGAMAATYVGFAFDLPPVLHLLAAILAAMIAGSLWGLIVGILKARVNANEVIVTIMLNSVASLLLRYALKTDAFVGGGFPGRSMSVDADAAYPLLLGSEFRLHWGFVLALVMAFAVWWLMERSTLGFEIKAVGTNPSAARTAGISVSTTIIAVMGVSGALAGLAGTAPALGTEKFLTIGVAANYGFDALTVALLGGSRPRGIVAAGILFGAMNAGGSLMQAAAQIPFDIVQVSQAIIVLLIAAPPLVRWLLRLPQPRNEEAR